MINITGLQSKVHDIAVFLGYKHHDKKNTLAAIKRETKEFKNSITEDNQHIAKACSDIKNDKSFKNFYEKRIKGTNQDELPDIVIVIMSHCHANNIDLETILKNKIRYNSLRNKKPSVKRALNNLFN